jgi:hypothetical protein
LAIAPCFADLAENQAIDESVKIFGMAKMFGFLYYFVQLKLEYGQS